MNVVTSCSSMLCCSKDEALTLFYLCNPVTKTWKELPHPTQLRRYDFIGLAFDGSTRVCSLIIGRTLILGEENNMVKELTGCDGKVVLVYSKDLRLWRLNEDDGDERWSELPELPRRLCRQVLYTGSVNDFGSQRSAQVVVDGSGWICVHLPRNKMVVFDGEGRVMQTIEGRQMAMFTQTRQTTVRAFEINNVWWP
ncbi:hypothetical protein SUGI_0697450 [Cryptomeria japonica]|nr:hypothetical protein SUGI_0697450 [Cryptomeria japonica]